MTARYPIDFALIAESINDSLVVTEADVTPPGPLIVYVNPAFTRLTGYSAEEAVGATPRMLQGPGTSRATLDTIKAALTKGAAVREKILNFSKAGTPYWLDLNIVELRNAAGEITHFAAIQRDVTGDMHRLSELEDLADRDPLTGVANRRAFLRCLDREFVAGGRALCLGIVDVDHFKSVNDGQGHAAGDAVLTAIAECLAANTRRSDIVGRIGGDEFALCMPLLALRDAHGLAERLCHAVTGWLMENTVGPPGVTISIGVAERHAADSVATLMARADVAMYAAKRAGRNRVGSEPRLPLQTREAAEQH